MKKMLLILAILACIAFTGCIVSAEQILNENHARDQVVHAVGGIVEDGTVKALLVVDTNELSSDSSSIFSGFSSETHVSVISASAQSSKRAPVANAAPVGRIVSITPNPATKGNSVTFKGSGTDKDGSIKGYLWKIDGTIVSTKASFSNSKLALGTHVITFSVQDNRGTWSSEVSATLNIESPNVAPVAVIELLPSTETFGTEVHFMGSGTDTDGSVIGYRWTIDGITVSDTSGFSTSSIAVGTHAVTFSVQDDDGAWSKPVTATIIITEPPKLVANIDVVTPNPATKDDTVSFKGSGTDTYPDSSVTGYLWKIDGESVSSDASFTKSGFDVGTYTITFSVQDNYGTWSEEATETLTVTEVPVDVPSEATVILTFDDGFKSDYSIVYPMLKARNMHSTHYIIPSMVGADSTRMSWTNIQTMYADGVDIECHSYTHNDLTAMSAAKISNEMVLVNNAFTSHGLPVPRHTAYPYGECNDNVISAISPYRDSGRVVTWQNSGYYPTEYLEKPYGLPCYPTDYGGTIAEIDKAIAGDYVLILGFHRITDSPSSTYEMSTSEFESILSYIESHNIRTETISEYYAETFEP